MIAKRSLCFLIVMTVVLSALSFVPAGADVERIKWEYYVSVRVSTKKDSGSSEGNIKVRFEFENMDERVTLSGTNSKGEKATATLTTTSAPWTLNNLVFENYTKDGFRMQYINLEYNVSGGASSKQSLYYEYPNGMDSSGGVWIQTDDGDKPEYSCAISDERYVRYLGNYQNVMNKTIYIAPDDTRGTESFRWDGKCGGDYQAIISGKKQYDSRSVSEPPSYSYTVTGRKPAGSGTNTVTVDKSAFKESIIDKSDSLGFDIDYAKLARDMGKDGINSLSIDSKITFDGKHSRLDISGDAKLQIVRRAIAADVDNIKTSANYYHSSRDNDYYNNVTTDSGKKQITVSVPIKTGNANNHVEAKNLDGQTFYFDDAYLELGKTKTKLKAAEKNVTLKNNVLLLTFPYSEGATSDNDGIVLVIKNGRVTPKDYTEDFKLWDNETKSEFRHLISSKKVDAVMPVVSVSGKNGAELNKWHKTVTVEARPEKDLRAVVTNNGQLSDNFINMELLSGNNEKVKIYNYKGSESSAYPAGVTQKVPVSKGSPTDITLRLYDKTEGIYKLKLSGTDTAGNPLSQTVENIYLDNKAPVVLISENYSETQGSAAYNTTITDASGTGRLYYCFTDGNLPEFDGTTFEKKSEVIDDLVNKWAFVDQKDSGSAILISVEKGKNFKGRLVYFGEDGLGNRSQTNSTDVNIINESSECTITPLSGTSVPQPNHSVMVTSNENNKIYYRWRDERGTFLNQYTLYTGVINTADREETRNLNGVYTLRCKIVTPSGAEPYYELPLAFDNEAPAVSAVPQSPNTYKDTQTIAVTASDASGIKSGVAQITAPDGSAIEGFEKFALDISDTVISQNVNISEIKSGAYALKVRAEDIHGNVSEVSSPVFCIRNEKPEVQAEVVSEHTYNGSPLLSSKTCRIKIMAAESFANSKSAGEQKLFYRISDNISAFGAWKEACTMNAADDGFDAQYTAELNEVALADGGNTLYIQTAVGTDSAKINSNTVQLNELSVYADFEAPSAWIVKDDIHTSESVVCRLYAEDNFDAELTVTCSGADVVKSEEKNAYDITVSENGTYNVTVTDTAGNSLKTSFTVNCIDREAPTAEILKNEQRSSGDRKDAYMSFTVFDAKDIKLVFIPENEYSAALENDKIKDSYFDGYDESIIKIAREKSVEARWEGDRNVTYGVSLVGYTGSYYVGVRAADSVGNTADIILDAILTAQDAALDMTYDVSPKSAFDRAAVKVNFNMPVYVLDREKIVTVPEQDKTLEETNFDIAASLAGAYSQKYTFIANNCGDYVLYTIDDIGRRTALTLTLTEEDVKFNSDAGVNAVTFRADRTKVEKGEFTSSWVGSYIELTPVDHNMRLMYTSKYREQGLDVDTSSSVGSDEEGYSKLVYRIMDLNIIAGTYEPADSNERIINLKIFDEGTDPAMGADTIAVIDTIDNSEPEFTISAVPQFFGDLRVEPIEIFYTPQNIVMTVRIQDKDSGIKEIRLGHFDIEGIGDVELTIPMADDNGNVLDYSKTPWVEDCTRYGKPVLIEYFGDTDLKGEKIVKYTFTDNATMPAIAAENGAGGVAYISNNHKEGISTMDAIFKMPIEEGIDYTVKYYSCNADGVWSEMTDNTAFCKQAKAVINLEQRGIERNLYVKNNGGSLERELSRFEPSFNFELRDMYGYKASVNAAVANFDTIPGTVDYTLSTTAKTNQPVTITITAEDKESGVASVTVGGISLTRNGDVFTGQITENGAYSIVMYDNVGNRTVKNFNISNINMTVPEAKFTLSTYETTSKSVSAYVTFTGSSNVRITGAAPYGHDFTEADYSINYAASVITFLKNGNVIIVFEDEYGNSNQTPISVNNIDTTPPSLECVATVNPQKSQVAVTFKEPDGVKNRFGMEELNVTHGGVGYKAKDAKYVIYQNGYYTFKISDPEGMYSSVTLHIEDIDTAAPVIKKISWSYEAYDDNGNLVPKSGSHDVNGEAGYRVATDIYDVTNQDVTVIIETDAKTRPAGSDGDYSETNQKVYTDNGMYIFNMEKSNMLSASYGVDLRIIDKTPPVIDLLGNNELIFYEHQLSGTPYNKDEIITPGIAFKAYDNSGKLKSVSVDTGSFDADNLKNNEFDSSKPYTVTYTAVDTAGNVTKVNRTIRLVGMYDTIALINGMLPDSTGRCNAEGDTVNLTLNNFPDNGIAYVRYAPGIKTMGEMKTEGTTVAKGQSSYSVSGLSAGWYTFFVQTDKRDYFTIYVNLYN